MLELIDTENAVISAPQSIYQNERLKELHDSAIKEFNLEDVETQKLVHDFFNEYSKTLLESKLDSNGNIEMYSPVLSDSVIFKMRIALKTESSIQVHHSFFYADKDTGEVLEKFLDSYNLHTTDLTVAFRKAFNHCKCFIVFDKFNLETNARLFEHSEELCKALTRFYEMNAPVAY